MNLAFKFDITDGFVLLAQPYQMIIRTPSSGALVLSRYVILAINFLHVLQETLMKRFFEMAWDHLQSDGRVIVMGYLLDDRQPSREAARLNLTMMLNANTKNPSLQMLKVIAKSSGFNIYDIIQEKNSNKIIGIEFSKEHQQDDD